MSDGLELKPTEARVLRLIVERPSRAKEMVGPGLSEQTVHRVTSGLRERGYVSAKNGIQSATPAGIRALESIGSAGSLAPRLPIPALDLLPTVEHRAYVEIGLCAAAARTHLGLLEGLPGIVLVGDSGAQKTRASRALVAAAGGDPYEDVVEAALHRGRGVFVRHNSQGEEISRSHLLDRPVAVFDECEKIEDGTAQLVIEQAYFHGTARVQLEKSIEMKAMPVAVMNARAPIAAGFAKRTGFHPSIFRRVVYAELEGLNVPKGHGKAGKTKDWLKDFFQVDAARKVKLPKPKAPGLEAAARIRRALDAIVANKAVAAKLDEYMLEVIAKGATAWLDDETAIRLVLRNWAILSARTGILIPDWELVLKMHFDPKRTQAELEAEELAKNMRTFVQTAAKAFHGDILLATRFAELLIDFRSRGLELGTEDGLKRLSRMLSLVATDLERNWKLTFKLLGFPAWLETQGATLATVEALATAAGAEGVGHHPKRAAYLVELGQASLDDGHHLTMNGREVPWPGDEDGAGPDASRAASAP